MNQLTGELKYLDELTEEQKKSGMWKEVRSAVDILKDVPTIGPIQNFEERKRKLEEAMKRSEK